jgi:hypothetical protein
MQKISDEIETAIELAETSPVASVNHLWKLLHEMRGIVEAEKKEDARNQAYIAQHIETEHALRAELREVKRELANRKTVTTLEAERAGAIASNKKLQRKVEAQKADIAKLQKRIARQRAAKGSDNA